MDTGNIAIRTHIYAMLVTLELNDVNSDRVYTYLSARSIPFRILCDLPHYHVCLVSCTDRQCSWLALLL
jgi:hypothetical protein